MALGRFRSPTQISFASVGNIAARCWSEDNSLVFLPKRGILGTRETHAHEEQFIWNPKWVFVLHTDGLRTRWSWEDFPKIEQDSAETIASRLMRELANENDDATVLVVKASGQ